ncbi:MAG: sn-glycerol-3-phosphate ABC transporter ATP-binding protein UgpC [Deltaproteobacteria bacterium]|nr:sn-glycerol-3-phosphate ABC transporter ATP-binding protein UgpC [Deltaproteobacteria bacterium]
MARVILQNVKKNYGKVTVIHGISMEIDNGELIVIVGPSGCGKSTLLRMVAGLERITEGTVIIGERVVNDLEPRERDIAMVFQNYALYPHMSVFNNMAYGLKIAGMDKQEIKQRVGEAASLLELEPFLKRKPRQLSGGQRQRVAMGRAIVRNPAVFLFDEPLSNLDAKLRVQMRMEIKTLQQKLGVTSLYVTHDQVEAMTMADRMIVMHNGIAEQIGNPLEVYHNPATIFVAGFIGSPPMNFLVAEIKRGIVHLNNAGTITKCSQADQSVTVGIRPEHLRLCPSGKGIFSAIVRFTEALGAETLIHLKNNNDEDLIIRLASTEQVPESGAEIGIDCDTEYVFLFDSEGNRLPTKIGA